MDVSDAYPALLDIPVLFGIRQEGGRASRAVVEARVASAVECRARTRGRGIIEENEESHGQVTTHNGDERGQGNVPIPT